MRKSFVLMALLSDLSLAGSLSQMLVPRPPVSLFVPRTLPHRANSRAPICLDRRPERGPATRRQ
ncbi:hypothetical protein [Deinococcus multiflagellatus]|uniref:Secreted protein n=1 Tax=Deinococcus multiflagellatus TaxID=1656887 RepID=A0ABW1ZQA3_9DEIO|nr:hypothetical protein [Deinococcus multiflagellatus]MBZ9715501.1 hypothetical protein [Deinococcus multiflagellatus]